MEAPWAGVQYITSHRTLGFLHFMLKKYPISCHFGAAKNGLEKKHAPQKLSRQMSRMTPEAARKPEILVKKQMKSLLCTADLTHTVSVLSNE